MYYIIEIFEDPNKNKLHILSTENEFLNFEFDKDIKKSIGSTHLPIDNFINPFDLFFSGRSQESNLMYCLALFNESKIKEYISLIHIFSSYKRRFNIFLLKNN